MSKKSKAKQAVKAERRTTLSGLLTTLAVFGIVALAVAAAVVSMQEEAEEA